MTQRQLLRQLAEAGRLRLQEFDDAALAHLLRDELVTVAGQTVTLTDKGRRRVAPKKTTTKVAKPLHPLTPLRRNYPVGRREQPSKRGYYAAEERRRREVAEWMKHHGPPPIDWSNPGSQAPEGTPGACPTPVGPAPTRRWHRMDRRRLLPQPPSQPP